MRIGNGTVVFRGGYTPARQAVSTAAPGPSKQTFAAQLKKLDDELIDLREVLESARLGGARRRAPLAQGFALDLSATKTAAQMTSAEEVNTRDGSTFGTTTPDWSGTTTAAPTLSGTYDGDQDDTITVTVDRIRKNGDVNMTARNAAGDKIGDIRRKPGHDIDRVYNLGDGIEVQFADGDFTEDDTFTFDVFTDPIGSLDPNAAVGTSGPDGPGFDPGHTITNGTFEVNGIEIAVSTSDTVNDILNRITASDAGVSASYDAATDSVVLTSTDTGTDAQIALSNDTSGILAALKLDGQPTAYGGEQQGQVMADFAAFAGVAAGTLSVNGTEIAIDPASQSIHDVVAAIEEIEGVDAQVTSDGRFRIIGESGETLTLSDTSGLLDATGITEGTYQGGRSRDRRISNLMARRIAAETQQVQTAMEALAAHTESSGLAARVGEKVESLVADAFEGSLAGYARFNGLDDLDDGRSGPLSRGSREVRAAYGEVSTAWLGEGGRGGGLLEDLQSLIDDTETKLLRTNVRV